MVRVRVRLKNRISKFLAVYRGCLVNVWGKCSTPSLAATNSAIARYVPSVFQPNICIGPRTCRNDMRYDNQ